MYIYINIFCVPVGGGICLVLMGYGVCTIPGCTNIWEGMHSEMDSNMLAEVISSTERLAAALIRTRMGCRVVKC